MYFKLLRFFVNLLYLNEKCERLDIDALSVSFIMFLAMMGCVEPDKSQVSAVMI